MPPAHLVIVSTSKEYLAYSDEPFMARLGRPDGAASMYRVKIHTKTQNIVIGAGSVIEILPRAGVGSTLVEGAVGARLANAFARVGTSLHSATQRWAHEQAAPAEAGKHAGG